MNKGNRGRPRQHGLSAKGITQQKSFAVTQTMYNGVKEIKLGIDDLFALQRRNLEVDRITTLSQSDEIKGFFEMLEFANNQGQNNARLWIKDYQNHSYPFSFLDENAKEKFQKEYGSGDDAIIYYMRKTDPRWRGIEKAWVMLYGEHLTEADVEADLDRQERASAERYGW